MNITNEQIKSLQISAGAAGDQQQVDICEAALYSEDEGQRAAARAECARVLQVSDEDC